MNNALQSAGLRIGAWISNYNNQYLWRVEDDLERTVIPITWHAVSTGGYGFTALHDKEFGVASALSRVSLEHSVYAFWLTQDTDALKKFDDDGAHQLKRYVSALKRKFPGTAGDSRLTSPKFGDALKDAKRLGDVEQVFESLRDGALLFMAWKRMTQYVHPSRTLVHSFWLNPETERGFVELSDDTEAITRTLVSSLAIAAEALLTCQPQVSELRSLMDDAYALLEISAQSQR